MFFSSAPMTQFVSIFARFTHPVQWRVCHQLDRIRPTIWKSETTLTVIAFEYGWLRAALNAKQDYMETMRFAYSKCLIIQHGASCCNMSCWDFLWSCSEFTLFNITGVIIAPGVPTDISQFWFRFQYLQRPNMLGTLGCILDLLIKYVGTIWIHLVLVLIYFSTMFGSLPCNYCKLSGRHTVFGSFMWLVNSVATWKTKIPCWENWQDTPITIIDVITNHNFPVTILREHNPPLDVVVVV